MEQHRSVTKVETDKRTVIMLNITDNSAIPRIAIRVGLETVFDSHVSDRASKIMYVRIHPLPIFIGKNMYFEKL